MPDTTSLPERLEALRAELARVPALDAAALDAEEIRVLGRKQGALTEILKGLPALSAEEKRALGAAANRLKQEWEAAIAARRAALAGEAQARAQARIDRTMPGRERWQGASHPVTRVVEEIVAIFHGLGFARATGPEAETEWYNFGALNFPPDHPAMDMHDTLYLDIPDRRKESDRRLNRSSGIGAHERRAQDRRTRDEGRLLLRTHTSPVQIRVMLEQPPPIRVVIPGMVYRKDPFDASHAPAFAQIEGLAVDEGISFVDLKATLAHFAREFFGTSTRVRFRPSYFPFTEPSAEMDVSCGVCGGTGCPACKGTGWMEILGAGMVHPRVIASGGLDPERYTGFAFGMGPGRIAMNRYGITDIRLLYEGDMRFLEQFVAGAQGGRRPGGQP
ncbi:MAG TPA: phenylalanine--tRNA ligase subunit alpha [Gemmatimonadales bacterium]|nr:phenylalanine--tRNA ligase subunit alpha [Gemmatimonadales bacterium]